jgi:hypothetical protein
MYYKVEFKSIDTVHVHWGNEDKGLEFSPNTFSNCVCDHCKELFKEGNTYKLCNTTIEALLTHNHNMVRKLGKHIYETLSHNS